MSSICLSQLDQGCVIPCPTAEDITKRGVPPMSPPLAMWEREAQVVELEKGESGLGFSILDYQVSDMPLSMSANRTDSTGLQ